MTRMRTREVILVAIIALGFIIHQIGLSVSALGERLNVFLAILGLLVVAGAAGTMIYDRVVTQRIDADEHEAIVPQPAISRFLFHDTRSAPLWLVLRMYVGIAWFTAGFEKAVGSPSWLTNGNALKGFWTNAAAIPKTGKPAISYDWYRTVLQSMLDHQWYTWFSKAICIGEMLVGIGLIVGGVVGVAAFFGALMNMSFLLAGSSSTNPVLFTLAILLMLAWQVAGYWGADRFILPVLGAPWKPGILFRRNGSLVTGAASVSGD